VTSPFANTRLVRRWGWRAILLVLTGVSLYLVAPSLIEVFSSAPSLRRIRPGWLAPLLALEVLSFSSIWALQRICLRERRWRPVVLAQLAGNAVGRVVPGGNAAGATLQYKMLADAGVPRGAAVSGLTASNLVTFSTLLALPVLVLPAILAGISVDRGLAQAAWLGAAGFGVMATVGAVMLATDRPLMLVGKAIQQARNRLLRGRRPLQGLPDRLLRERDSIRRVLGERWWQALLAAVGWWLFDYAALVVALGAVGAKPDPALVLLAYAGAQILAMIPLTPGGLGFVEAGLTGLLALGGVSAGNAALATLAYRLVSYWLPLPAGAIAAVIHRRRYGGGEGAVADGAAAG
jgi:uncharacterized protein (TIRG00374 family)